MSRARFQAVVGLVVTLLVALAAAGSNAGPATSVIDHAERSAAEVRSGDAASDGPAASSLGIPTLTAPAERRMATAVARASASAVAVRRRPQVDLGGIAPPAFGLLGLRASPAKAPPKL